MFKTDELRKALPDGVTLGRKIHDGGQRKVYEADGHGRRVVVKVMPGDDRNRAEREVSIGFTFDHPNLARILDQEVFEVELDGEEYVWFREEFIDGEPLAKRRGSYDQCQALSLAADLIAAVEYLWGRHNVVHRDIKPLNIIRRPDGSFVLIDVGIGRHQGETSITSGVLGPGTPGHIAPEQLEINKGRDLDVRTDLFLIGIVVFEVLTGALPFRPSRADYHAKLLDGDWSRPQGLSPALAGLLERLLARHPHQRPSLAQAEQMVAAARSELQCS